MALPVVTIDEGESLGKKASEMLIQGVLEE
jgi:hypothetical protein